MICRSGNAIWTTLNLRPHDTLNNKTEDCNKNQISNQISDQSSYAKIVITDTIYHDKYGYLPIQPTKYIYKKAGIMGDFDNSSGDGGNGAFIGNAFKQVIDKQFEILRQDLKDGYDVLFPKTDIKKKEHDMTINTNNRKRSRDNDGDIESPVKKRRLNDNGKEINDNNDGKNTEKDVGEGNTSLPPQHQEYIQKKYEELQEYAIKNKIAMYYQYEWDVMQSAEQNAESNGDELKTKDEMIMKREDQKSYVTIYLCCYIQIVNKKNIVCECPFFCVLLFR